jgi:D-apiose dehydrogenase
MTKVCVIGAGYYAHNHVKAWQALDGVTLAGVADLDLARAQSLAAGSNARAYDDALRMVAELAPDLVDLVTPEASHAGLVEALAARVQAIVCQKPLAPTLSAARAIVESAQRQGCALFVHENFRFQPWFQAARALLDSGRLGPPRQLAFHLRPGDGRGPEAYRARQPYFTTMTRFLVHEAGIHYIDVFRHLMGEVAAVTARLQRVNPAIAGEDAGLIVFEFTSGARGLLDANRDLDHAAADARYTMGRMHLECERGELRLDGEGRLWQRERGQAQEALLAAPARVQPNGGSVIAFQADLLAALRQGVKNQASAYLRNIEVEEAIYRSHEEARTVWLA